MGNFLPNLTIVFIVLKLMGEIDWSWLVVTSPMWGAFIFLVWIKISNQVKGQW